MPFSFFPMILGILEILEVLAIVFRRSSVIIVITHIIGIVDDVGENISGKSDFFPDIHVSSL